MAQIIMTAGEVEKLVAKVKPAVEEWAGDLAREREIWYGNRKRALDEAGKVMTAEEIGHEAERRRVNQKAKRWRRPKSFEDFVRDVEHEDLLAARERKMNTLEEFMYTDPPMDQVTPVLNYLEKLTSKLDPEATIALTDKETFQMMKALEIANVDDPRTEAGVS